MDKRMATIQSLENKAVAAGISANVVKNRFTSKYGNTQATNRCQTKNRIITALNGIIKPISYGNKYVANQLVPLDNISFYEYDNRTVNIYISNEGSKKILKDAFEINVYCGQGSNSVKIGGGTFPNDVISKFDSISDDLTTRIEKDLLTNSGYFTISSRGGHYGQFESCTFEWNDDDGDHRGGTFNNLQSISQDYKYYPLNYIGLYVKTKDGGITQKTINVQIEYQNNTKSNTENNEIVVYFYDANNNLKKTSYMPKTSSMSNSMVTATFNVDSDKTKGRIVVSTSESHTLNVSFDYGQVYSDESEVVISNTTFNTNCHLYISAY